MQAYTIFGPPGTGKTTEILTRVSNIIKGGADEAGVFFMSFTKAAAQEALSRVGHGRSNTFSTIHSLCYRLTRVNYNAVVDFAKLRELASVTGVTITNRGVDEEDVGVGDIYLQIIGKAENLLVSYEEAYETSNRDGSYDEFIMFAQAYNEWKKTYGYVDFNDMLSRTLGPGIKFSASHLMIDEAQDLSPLQWKVIDRLIGLANPDEVHACGDDDQALYRWAGADPHGLHEFEKRYNATRHVLSQSWRVPRRVHHVAHKIADCITRRVDKKYEPKDAEGEVNFGVDLQALDLRHGENTMVLGRTHSVLKEVEDVMKAMQLPYTKNGGYSLWSNRYAQSIRAVKKTQRREDPSDAEYKALLKTVNPRHRQSVEEGDYSVFRKLSWLDILDVPYNMISYYEAVDIELEPTITLSTIHGAKGKEADRVVLMTKLTPRIVDSMNRNNESADDEHRVFYVGVTRAKQQLDIIGDSDGYQVGNY